MDLSVTTLLDVPPESAWEEIQKPALMEFVASPLVSFEPIEPPSFPERFEEDDYLVELKLFGIVPIGTQTISVTRPEIDETPGEQFYRLRDNGTGQLASTWDHEVTIRETSDGKTVYTDEVTVDAGILTLFVWLFASVFYRYRQWRWQKLVASGFDPLQ